MEPLVSIIIPVFNAQETISLTIENLLNQTYKNFEIIFVDDASIDLTLDKIQYFAEQNEKIKLIETPAEGFSFAQNKALKKAKGKYVIFYKCGNLMSYNLLEYLVQIAENNKSDITSCDFIDIPEHVFFQQHFKIPEQPKENITEKTPAKYLRKLTTYKRHSYLKTYCLWNKLINKKILKNFSFPEDKANFDKFSIIDIINRSNKVLMSNQILIMNTLFDEYFNDICFSYYELEDIEFLQNLLIKANKENLYNDIKNISLHLFSLICDIRKKLSFSYYEIYDAEKQIKNLHLKFNSIYKFLKKKNPALLKTYTYKKLIKKYFYILRVEPYILEPLEESYNEKIKKYDSYNPPTNDANAIPQ